MEGRGSMLLDPSHFPIFHGQLCLVLWILSKYWTKASAHFASNPRQYRLVCWQMGVQDDGWGTLPRTPKRPLPRGPRGSALRGPMFDRPPVNVSATAVTTDGHDIRNDVGFMTSKPFNEDTGFVEFDKPKEGDDKVAIESVGNSG
ncbi:hypothetical protein OESDEN_18495 [Oesophagostomum dentatum]|uniref:Uncharacterized protein n=1 Tax=Oesophagostomum dentatum TaxID=61180 RepID=A0A0B1SD39_OESDE|nr:hypothetical protein OESDEN_18495 [Oesophagostomum dentatum]